MPTLSFFPILLLFFNILPIQFLPKFIALKRDTFKIHPRSKSIRVKIHPIKINPSQNPPDRNPTESKSPDQNQPEFFFCFRNKNLLLMNFVILKKVIYLNNYRYKKKLIFKKKVILF